GIILAQRSLPLAGADASMRPRVFTRGIMDSCAENLSRVDCFNEAARLHARNPSSGARPARRSIRFNEAARLHARNPSGLDHLVFAGPGFNEAARLHARNQVTPFHLRRKY